MRRQQIRTEWLDRITRFKASGLSKVEFCRVEGLRTYSFYRWYKRFEESSVVSMVSAKRFVRVEVERVSVGERFEISFPFGIEVRSLSRLPDAMWVAKVAQALREGVGR